MSHRAQTYVGFGFGAIQPGLLLYDAFRAQAFNRFVVAEILPELVTSMQLSKGMYTVNLAGMDGIHQTKLGPVELLDVAYQNDRQLLIQAIADAHEIGTAITTFNQYVMDIPGSLHLMVAEGLQRKVAEDGPSAVVYCAENNNHAAEMLQEAVFSVIPARHVDAVNAKVQFLNTVISKMCGLVSSAAAIKAHGLVPMWQNSPLTRALLVEDYDVLLINRITLPGFQRGITIFQEKDDLLPFKEAKLFGHNGTHAIAAYIGGFLGATRITDLASLTEVMAFLHQAFQNEVGTALCRKYAGYDELFTPDGFAEFASGIISRMLNPYLLDTIARVGRDPRRKLGWEDRLVGAIRVALEYGVQPVRYAFGTAAALVTLDPTTIGDTTAMTKTLMAIWHPQTSAKGLEPSPQEKTVLQTIETGMHQFREWQQTGYALKYLESSFS